MRGERVRHSMKQMIDGHMAKNAQRAKKEKPSPSTTRGADSCGDSRCPGGGEEEGPCCFSSACSISSIYSICSDDSICSI